jgi:uncharacterized protein (TIGR00251 family)
MENCFLKDSESIKLKLKVTPCASKSEVLSVQAGRLRVRIAAAPEDGKANTALIAFFSHLLECPKNQIAVVSGEKSRLKILSLPLSAEKKLEKIIFPS